MNKDTLVATVIGFGLGLVAAIALWVVPRILPKITTPQPAKQIVSASPTTLGNETTSFEITSVRDGQIVKVKTVKLEGKALGAQFVVITTPTDNQVATPSSDGSFNISLTLNEGGNGISVTSFKTESRETQDLFVYYFTEGI